MVNSLMQWESDLNPLCNNNDGCNQPATHILTCHQIDFCDGNPESCTAYVFCADCAKTVADKISEHVGDMIKADRKNGKTLTCKACHMEVTRLSQVLDVGHLTPVAHV